MSREEFGKPEYYYDLNGRRYRHNPGDMERRPWFSVPRALAAVRRAWTVVSFAALLVWPFALPGGWTVRVTVQVVWLALICYGLAVWVYRSRN